jgi:hypothetical protein
MSGIPPWKMPKAKEKRSTYRRSNDGCSIPMTQLMAKQSIARLNDSSNNSIQPMMVFLRGRKNIKFPY